MTKLDIYNIALKQHGKICTQSDTEQNNPPYEVSLCNTYYRSAVLKALGEADWSFLTVPVLYDRDYDFPEGGWLHGFLLPQGLYKVICKSDNPYEIIGNKFLTDEAKPRIYAIMDNFEPESVKDDFCYLVGYALAFELCGLLSPNNANIQNSILQSYTWTLESLLRAQSNPQIRTVEEGGSILEEQTIPEYRPHKAIRFLEGEYGN